MTTLLILTGPQGSGNHLFSKLFALDKNVNGWADLNKTYWIGHDKEPFSNLWRDTDLISDYDWSSHEYHVTSISCPYIDNGVVSWPDYQKFIKKVQGLGITVKIGIIGRDQNILKWQETRVRGSATYTDFFRFVTDLLNYEHAFLSQELAYLYGPMYLAQLSKQLEFPIDYNNVEIGNILKENANEKYLKSIDSHWLDAEVKKASRY
jgi:hypothetical protein